MEKIISGRSDMEAFAKELKKGEIKEYKIKFEKTGSYYKIDKERFDAYFNGGSDRKFYDEIGSESDFIPNPYYVEEGCEVVDIDEFDEFDDVKSEETVPSEEPCVAEDSVEEACPQETQVCECEGKIAELEKELDAKLVEIALKDDELLAKDVHIASLTAEINTLVERKTEQDAIHQDKVRELEEQITHLLEKLSAPIDYTNVPFETLVDEIASRGYEVELKYIKK